MDCKQFKEKFPVHALVWYNQFEDLERLLSDKEVNIEVIDARGRTPLHLAVTLGHLESVRVLLRHDANANVENSQYWTVVQEAIATGDPEIVQLCLQYRDIQRHSQRSHGVPGLLQRLKESPDFYVEMKWEFTSWIPLVARVCPSDTYKVWKKGSCVRIDTTLLGFDNMSWQRGSRSYLFKGQADMATFMEIDHDAHQIFTETIRMMPMPSDVSLMTPSEDAVAARLTAPIVTTYIDTDKITFERSKSGIWGWRNDKTEIVNGYSCKVFSASNVQLVTKSRTEHLTEQDKKRTKKVVRSPLESFLGVAEEEEKLMGAAANGELTSLSRNPCHITPEEYFDSNVDLNGRDIGRPIEQSMKTQRFKAQMSLCEDYPLSLPEQVIPVIDLMAASNAHFRKLKDFITLQLPSGFPIKIEIPLFHVLNAKITFGNIFGSETPASGVICLKDGDDLSCDVDEAVFATPGTYSVIGDSHHERLRDEDDELLQFAIQQSLMERGSESDQVTLWEALNKSKMNNYATLKSQEEQLLQQALAESMGLSVENAVNVSCDWPPANCDAFSAVNASPGSSFTRANDEDEQLKMALQLSETEQMEAERRHKQEEEELEMILKLSLTEK